MGSQAGDGPFTRDHAPVAGAVEVLATGLRVVTAPNPGPMTFTGTRSYLLGAGRVALVDPGPEDARHADALVAALDPGERVQAILVTHAHRDHSGGAGVLSSRLDAPVLGFGTAVPRPLPAGMAGLAPGGGEGVDAGFVPDRLLVDGAIEAGPGWRLVAVHTPGHLGDHLCFAWPERGVLFSGDTVMGWATSMISPPEGDLGDFLTSLRRLQGRAETVYCPGHGPPVPAPQPMLAWQLAHRAARSAQIRAVLAGGPARVADLVAEVYAGLDPVLRPAAARTVLAHLIDEVTRGGVVVGRPAGSETRFALA